MDVETYVRHAGKLVRVYVYEQASEISGRTTSALRSVIHRAGAAPAGKVTGNVPVFYPDDLEIESPEMDELAQIRAALATIKRAEVLARKQADKTLADALYALGCWLGSPDRQA